MLLHKIMNSLNVAIGIGIAVTSAEVFLEGHSSVRAAPIFSAISGLLTLTAGDGEETSKRENAEPGEHYC